MNEKQSQNLLLKVDPLSQTIRNTKWNTQGEKLETSAMLRVFVSSISSLPPVKATIYERRGLFHMFRRLYNTAQDIHFVL